MKWIAPGFLILDSSCVGTVCECAGNRWEAYGCDYEWQDVNLGIHGSEATAKAAVEQWVRQYTEAAS